MPRTLAYCLLIAVILLFGVFTPAWGNTDPPHSDYRPGYTGTGCAPGTGACHDVNQGTFLPNSFNHNDGTADDYTIFCLSCHNSAGEAHNRNVGVPSTNKYVNFTGIDPNFPYTGNAHSWNGVIENAGTRFPTLSGFMYDEYGYYHPNSPTLHMVSYSTASGKFYKVRCQTCHVAMYKSYWAGNNVWSGNLDWTPTSTSDNVRYRLNGYTSTKTYQDMFVQVYESTLTSRPVNSRTKEQYLVNPSQYTYKDRSALVVFKTAQPASDYINVDIRQPYLRFDNSYDKMCVDCHYGRPMQSATHAPGTGIKNGHPVSGILQGITVPFGYRYGLHSTLMPQTRGNVMLQRGNIYCTTCHQQHNAPSNDGELLRESNGTTLCGDCHKTVMNGYTSDTNAVDIHYGAKHIQNNEPPTQCLDCHTTHNTNNIMLIRNVINGKRVNFQNFTGASSFGPDTGFGVCEVCHTKTNHHLSDNAASGQGHHTDQNCTQCHKHSTGFQPTGGTAPCYACHDGSDTSAPNIKYLMGLGATPGGSGYTSRHVIIYDNTSSSCLAMCHTSNHNQNSPNLKTQPEVALCMSCHSRNGGANPAVYGNVTTTSQGDSIYMATYFGSSLHNYTARVQSEMNSPVPYFTYEGNCTKCHLPHGSANYPNLRPAINSNPVTGVNPGMCFSCHGGTSPVAFNIQTLWQANPAINEGHTGKNCVDCHSPHGSTNLKMIKENLVPNVASGTVTNVTSYQSSYKICLACHSGNGGSIYNVMTSGPGGYGPNFSMPSRGGSVHQFGLNVAIGGRTFNLTCLGCHNPHDTKNARLLQRQITFTGLTGTGSTVMVNVSAVVSSGDGISRYGKGWTNFCLVCHTSLSETGTQSPYIRHPLGVSPLLASSPAYYPYTTGLGMNRLPLEFATATSTMGTVSCITCHFAHGSPQPKLKRLNNATTPVNRICLQCHDKTAFLQGGQGAHGGFILNQGRCSDCHNMHDDGNQHLLVVATETDLCERCHAPGGISKYTVWKPITSANPMEFWGTAGTFGNFSEVRGGTAPSMHLINDNYTTAPGGITTEHHCGTCHNPHGSPNYRILRTAINNVSGIRVYAKLNNLTGAFIGYSSGVVTFCTACHTQYKNYTTAGVSGFIRHPIRVSLNNYTAQLNNFESCTSYKPKVELESGNKIVCLSCHFAHGSPKEYNLKYPGGSTVNTCRTCHGAEYNAGAQNAHAGYVEDNGTCYDCHSIHNPKGEHLLNYSTDTGVCVQCHNGPNPLMGSKVSRLRVWKGTVFDSPSSWLNTAGSFGYYDPTNGGTIGPPYPGATGSMHPINASAAIAPGGGPYGTGLATAVNCGTCHNTHGSTNYRILKTSLNGKNGIVVVGQMDAYGNTIAHISGMSSFCTACHTQYANAGTGAGYVRHPVDVSLNAQQLAAYNNFNGSKYLPLEANNTVTCITCHCAHGSPNPDLLRMTVPQLCQVCHAKGLDPTNGYQQVTHPHGGFTGNNGNCFACHYMHRRYDNLTSTVLNRKMLRYSTETELCYSCHALDGENHVNFPNAPIVWKGDAPSTPGGWDGTAGSFGAYYNSTTGGSAPSHHLINLTTSQAPGGTTTTHYCGTCHDPHGNDNYRMLRTTINNVTGIAVYAKTNGQGNFAGYSSGIVKFCTACHTQYGQTGTGVNGYLRHPLDIQLSGQEWQNLSTSTVEPKAQVENHNVMCLSCHYAHGSPSYKLLRMQSMTSSQAEICQQCHKKGYNAAGQQYQHPHGGFVGNNANCIVCHSVHADDNPYLLVESKEENLCRNCHSGWANFTSFKNRNPEVKLTAPSKYNVFTSVGNSFGLYSVGGGGVVSWHKVDSYGTAPGGITVDLRCGVCHDPHGEDNFVMLRSSFEGRTGIKVFGHLSSSTNTAEFNTYSSGFGKFCSVCHTNFTNCGTGSPWRRHPVDFQLQSAELHNWSTTQITPRVPLESAQRKVTCITCHNSHGSYNYNLMRLPGNGMCQQCHNR